MRGVLLYILIILATAPALAEPRSPALVVLEGAITRQKDPAALADALGKLDAMVATNPKDPDAHYARGWILSRTGKPEQAVTAYDRAFELDARLADAPYNAGVVLGRMGKTKEAAARFDRALAADPRHVDAAYNAGQSHYDLEDFAKAAARWETAGKLAPDDFQIAKKLVQAYVALGQPAKIKPARARVFALWKASKAPEVRQLTSYVYDQFAVGKYRIYVYESFDPSGDLAYVYQAKVTEQDKVLGSVNLETSAAIRERGVPYVIGIDRGGKHTTLGEHAFKAMPDYATFKTLVKQLVAARF
jgi:tetratricopeptide (TPR) repeat protein